MPVAVAKPINPGWERSSHASNTFHITEVIPAGGVRAEIPSILAKTKEGQALLGSTVTKVTTTHTSTKIITTRMAVGDDTEIARIIDTKAMQIAPTLPVDLDESAAKDVTDGSDGRKVSFPQDTLQSARDSTSTATQAVLFSGRLLKNGFRLFKNNWHPVDAVITRDGVLEWTNADAKDHSHSINLKELPAGFVVLGQACLDIPAYLSPKLPRGLNSEHLAAIAQRTPKNKLKTYWFRLESDDEMTRFKTALVQIVGTHLLQQTGPEVRKLWTNPEITITPPPPDVAATTVIPAVARGSTAFQHAQVLAPITDTETPEEEVKVKQRPDTRVVADEIISETRRQVETPRKRNMTAKEAFFAQHDSR
ncbi:uncharacterized protein LOC129583042 [Paramacrobiotus metropolitanus]|uniref:uncharacterized protein LOC129583042 n=1 Tax=Paramacrobiotus metropolitanus TaxID=2943436 RepID=UPI002445DC97|nr:uncharacterized protein LOC129583042 [Paramacrobiotus metropolitanus]XP_055330707.1 uncharacterized protein LOC129583042 [Paramacrobiotus metropolitanus]